MTEPSNYTEVLPNGWTATFKYLGEFKMGCDYWGMHLALNNDSINYFDKKIVLINDYNSESIKKAIRFDRSGIFAKISIFEEEYIIDFSRLAMTCLKINITCNKGNNYVTVVDQPAMDRARNYVTVDENMIYCTFPFVEIYRFNKVMDAYLEERREQIMELYFK
jgi:hypothetical protein